MDTFSLIPNNTLLTETPKEVRQMAVHIARLIPKTIQPNADKRERLRKIYANDPQMLIAVTQGNLNN